LLTYGPSSESPAKPLACARCNATEGIDLTMETKLTCYYRCRSCGHLWPTVKGRTLPSTKGTTDSNV
jgi:DNA-directed RNA polymerase subunit RPC12/RpoP